MPKTEHAELYIGLMSGTSIDAIDAALVSISANKIHLLNACGTAWPAHLRQAIIELSSADRAKIDDIGILDREIALAFASTAKQLLAEAGIAPDQIRAIGSHGQTLRHRPDLSPSFTWQIGDPNTIAEKTGITVVADFRRRDMAAGGQAAPLVPAFHQHIFAADGTPRAILNIGGIANLTQLQGNHCNGFDTGPGNTLLDGLMRESTGKPYDKDGHFCREGRVIENMLSLALNDPYFRSPPPKSTGPEYFSMRWLKQILESIPPASPRDVAATLIELSARSIADALLAHAPGTRELLVCGGGVHNPVLMARLRARLPGIPVASTEQAGVDPDWLEAMAFAWLAHRTLRGQPGNLPDVTGAAGQRILGGIYQA